MNIPLLEVWSKSPKHSSRPRILSFDPGETTGMFFLEMLPDAIGHTAKQLATPNLSEGYRATDYQIGHYLPDVVVCEDYKVYGHKVAQHSWAALHTPKFIGVITALCEARQIPIVMQMAGQAKGFATDDKLRAWGLYNSGTRHSNDAARHAIFYLLFGGKHEHRPKG